MFKRILFATDGSPVCKIAAKTAFELSQKYGSKLILVHVDTEADLQFCPFVPEMTDKRLSDDQYTDSILEGMKKAYSSIAGDFKDARYRVLRGNPSTQLIKFVDENQIDCIIMGVHAITKESAAKTLQTVEQKACCPVMTITRPCKASFWYFNQIVFGTDFSDASMAAFQFAYKLAVYIGCRLNIFHALEIGTSGSPMPLEQEHIENQIKAAKKKMADQYLPKMKDFDNYDMIVWEGIPYIELLKFSREKTADLIVMAHHSNGNDTLNILLGKTIEQVIFRSQCPVINVNQHSGF